LFVDSNYPVKVQTEINWWFQYWPMTHRELLSEGDQRLVFGFGNNDFYPGWKTNSEKCRECFLHAGSRVHEVAVCDMGNPELNGIPLFCNRWALSREPLQG
jgi:hypothetical protein